MDSGAMQAAEANLARPIELDGETAIVSPSTVHWME